MLKPLPPDRSHSLKVQRLKLALALLSSFFVLEMTAALGTGSLSLLADAGHVLSDVTALGITFAALWWTQNTPPLPQNVRFRLRVPFLSKRSPRSSMA
nr:cation transporter [Oscillatoria laete-virens]